MANVKYVSDEQKKIIGDYINKTGGQLSKDETEQFLSENNLPWNSVDAFRMWCKDNGFIEPGQSGSGGSRGASLSLKGIRKFGGETDATSIASLLLEDRSKAISGAIDNLNSEIDDIKVAAQQQINLIQEEANEQIKTRSEMIDQLRQQLPQR